MTAEQVTLPGMPEPVLPEPEEELSRQRRLTRDNYLSLERGIHPITRQPLARNDETCGSCAHLVETGGSVRNYFKCAKGSMTHSAASDVRKSWPACAWWEQSRA